VKVTGGCSASVIRPGIHCGLYRPPAGMRDQLRTSRRRSRISSSARCSPKHRWSPNPKESGLRSRGQTKHRGGRTPPGVVGRVEMNTCGRQAAVVDPPSSVSCRPCGPPRLTGPRTQAFVFTLGATPGSASICAAPDRRQVVQHVPMPFTVVCGATPTSGSCRSARRGSVAGRRPARSRSRDHGVDIDGARRIARPDRRGTRPRPAVGHVVARRGGNEHLCHHDTTITSLAGSQVHAMAIGGQGTAPVRHQVRPPRLWPAPRRAHRTSSRNRGSYLATGGAE